MNSEQKEALLAKLRREQNKDKERNSDGGTKISYFKIKGGEVIPVRFLPSGDDGEPWVEKPSHWGMSSNGRENIICRKYFNKACHVCDMISLLDKEDEDDMVAYDKFKGKNRYLIQLWNYDTEERMIWEAPITVYRQIRSYLINTHYGFDIFSLEDGFDFEIERTGNGMFDTEYDVKNIPGVKGPISDDEDVVEEIRESLLPLHSFYKDWEYPDEVVDDFMSGEKSPKEWRMTEMSENDTTTQKSNGKKSKK